MAKTIPTTEPLSFTAGETVKWSISDSDYPASAGTLGYFFVTSGGAFVETSSTPDGDTHQLVISATDSGLISAGDYDWQARYTETATGEETVIRAGSIMVKPEFTASAYDNRSMAQQALDAIEAVIVKLSAETRTSSSISDRSSTKKDLMDALAQRSKLKVEVAREVREHRAALGLDLGNKIRTRF